VDIKIGIYLLRFILAIAGGFISGLMKYGLEESGQVIIMASIIYLITVYISYILYKKRGLKPELKGIFLEGIGTFIIFWILIWTILYNILVIY